MSVPVLHGPYGTGKVLRDRLGGGRAQAKKVAMVQQAHALFNAIMRTPGRAEVTMVELRVRLPRPTTICCVTRQLYTGTHKRMWYYLARRMLGMQCSMTIRGDCLTNLNACCIVCIFARMAEWFGDRALLHVGPIAAPRRCGWRRAKQALSAVHVG